MERTASIELMGKHYTLNYSTGVTIKSQEKFAATGGFVQAADSENLGVKFEALVWMLNEMLQAGYRYEKLRGNDPPEPPRYEDLFDLLHVSDMGGVISAISDALTAGTRREVEIDDGKNSETTSGA